jgi:hypothetical protein
MQCHVILIHESKAYDMCCANISCIYLTFDAPMIDDFEHACVRLSMNPNLTLCLLSPMTLIWKSNIANQLQMTMVRIRYVVAIINDDVNDVICSD